jgi:hypothetical protein
VLAFSSMIITLHVQAYGALRGIIPERISKLSFISEDVKHFEMKVYFLAAYCAFSFYWY